MLTRKRSAWLVAIVLVFALVGAACSDDKKTTTSASSSSAAPQGANIDYKSLTGTLNGSRLDLPGRVQAEGHHRVQDDRAQRRR